MTISRVLRHSSIAALFWCGAQFTAPSVAFAADPEEAVAHYERGVKLFETQAYDAAYLEFQKAYKLSGNYKLLYNLGVVATELKDYVAAIDDFTNYLSAGGADIKEERRADVRDRLNKLALLVTKVSVTSNAAGAELSVDDRMVGTLPLTQPLPIKTGRRKFTASSRGKTVVKFVEVSAGETPTVALDFDTTAPSSDVPPGGNVEASKPSFPVVPWLITGALGAGAVVTGVLAVSARNDLATQQATFGTSRADLDSSQSKAQTFGIVTDVLLVGTLVGAAVSSFFTIKFFGSRSSSATLTPQSVHFRATF
jgi:hypothetical protein